MRIAYISHTRFPTEKAHGRQIAEVCAALAGLGHTVILYAPRAGEVPKDPLASYGLSGTFRVVYPNHRDAWRTSWIPGALAFALNGIFFARALTSILRHDKPDLLYTRSAWMIPWIAQARVRIVLELHSLPNRFRGWFVRQCRRASLVVCLTSPMREELVSSGVVASQVIVAGDCVNLSHFSQTIDAASAKSAYTLPHDRPVIGYIGSFVTLGSLEKGVHLIIEACTEFHMRGRKAFFWIVGGPKEWRERYEAQARDYGLSTEQIRFTDSVPSHDVPRALAAFDVCVYPAPHARHPFFRRDTSPLKLLEYMAAKRPIVCAELPPIHDLVDATMVQFFTPGNAVALADGIAQVLEHPDTAAARTHAAWTHVQTLTWEKRMERILAHLS